jgi:hypothetical protein
MLFGAHGRPIVVRFGARLSAYYFKVLWTDPRLGRLDPAPTISAAVRSDGTVVVADDGACRLEP